ncbi:MAG: tetratricopeptide repeat protein [Chloroflexota bacterium]
MTPNTAPRPIAVALLNLNGLGLGYLHLERFRRWLAHGAVTANLAALTWHSATLGAPPIWESILGLWLLWMVLDGWRQARKQARFTSQVSRSWAPLAVAVVIIGLEAGGLWWYRAQAQAEFIRGQTAYELGDAGLASRHLGQVISTYALSHAPYLPLAREHWKESQSLLLADDLWQKQDYSRAALYYEAHLSAYPDGPFARRAATQASEVYSQWAAGLLAEGNYQVAIEKYRLILARYPQTAPGQEAAQQEAEAHLAWARQLAQAGEYALAVDKLQIVLEEFSGTQMAAQAETELADLFTAAGQKLNANSPCDAAPILAAFAAGDSSWAAEANALMPQAFYGCGQAEHRAERYATAITAYETLIANYPNSPLIPEAQAALVDARVADIEAKGTSELPPPQRSGSAPAGVAEVVISNDSPEQLEVLLSGPGSQSLTMEKCGPCQTYFVAPLSCPEKGPQATVTLTPGRYKVVVRAISDPSVRPWSGTWNLDSGNEYFNCFFIIKSLR